MKILEILSHDRERPSSRKELSERSGMTDRSVRENIERLRRQGHWIISLKTGGYYITDNPDEWNAFVEREKKRATAVFKYGTVVINGQTKMEVQHGNVG